MLLGQKNCLQSSEILDSLSMTSILQAHNGAPWGFRTPNLQIRSLPLYPIELMAHRKLFTHYYNTPSDIFQYFYIVFYELYEHFYWQYHNSIIFHLKWQLNLVLLYMAENPIDKDLYWWYTLPYKLNTL